MDDMTISGMPHRALFLDPSRITLKRVENGAPTLMIGGMRYDRIKIRQAFPLSDERRYLAFFDEEDTYIGMVGDMVDLDPAAQQTIDDELRWRYFIPRITRIRRMWNEAGQSFIEADTDCGPITIRVRGLREHIVEIGPGRILITDDHDNRFEIRDVARLDRKSRRMIQRVA